MSLESLPVNVKHGESLDIVVAENLLLVLVNVAEANVDELLNVEAHVVLDPAKVLVLVVLGEAGEEGEGHAVDVARVGALGGVDVGVGVDPDDGNLAVEALAGGLGGAGNGADGDGVVAAEAEGEAALGGVGVGGLGNLAVDGRDEEGVLHAAVVGVGGGGEVLVELDLGVAVEVVLELVLDLGEEAGLDEGGRAVVDTSLGLLRVSMCAIAGLADESCRKLVCDWEGNVLT